MASTLVLSALLFASSAFAAPNPSIYSYAAPSSGVCSKAPFAAVLPLSAYGPAAAFCTSSYPASACGNATDVFTSTVYSTATIASIVGTSTIVTGTSTESTAIATLSFTSFTETLSTLSITGTVTEVRTAAPFSVLTTETSTTTVTVTATSTATALQQKRDLPAYFSKTEQPACTVKPGACTTYTTTYLVPIITVISEPGVYPTGKWTLSSGSASAETATSYGAPKETAPLYSAPKETAPSYGASKETAPSYSTSVETGSSSSTESCSSTLTPSKPSYTVPAWASYASHAQNSTFASSKKSASTSSSSCTTSTSASSYEPLPTPYAATTSVDSLSSLFSSLKVQPASFISTACSCIESQAACSTASRTFTTTLVITTTSASTVLASIAATETTSVTAFTTLLTGTTITNLVAQTDSLTITPTYTSTITEVVTTTTTSTVTETPTPPACSPTGFCNSGYLYQMACDQRIDVTSSNLAFESSTTATTAMNCLLACSDDSACAAYDFDYLSQKCNFYEDVPGVSADIETTPASGWQSGYVYDICTTSQVPITDPIL